MVISALLFILAFLGFIVVIVNWKRWEREKRRMFLRSSYFLAFLGIIVSYFTLEFYSENLITSFAFLLIGFTVSEIYDRMIK